METFIEIELTLSDLAKAIGVKAPVLATAGSAAVDLQAVLPVAETEVQDGVAVNNGLTLWPGERVAISSGISIRIPNSSYVGLVFPRSGLGSRGLVLANGTGVIDSDYRGEIILHLVNNGDSSITIQPGDRIAQLMITPVIRPMFKTVEVLTQDTPEGTVRGMGGFGSTGTAPLDTTTTAAD